MRKCRHQQAITWFPKITDWYEQISVETGGKFVSKTYCVCKKMIHKQRFEIHKQRFEIHKRIFGWQIQNGFTNAWSKVVNVKEIFTNSFLWGKLLKQLESGLKERHDGELELWGQSLAVYLELRPENSQDMSQATSWPHGWDATINSEELYPRPMYVASSERIINIVHNKIGP